MQKHQIHGGHGLAIKLKRDNTNITVIGIHHRLGCSRDEATGFAHTVTKWLQAARHSGRSVTITGNFNDRPNGVVDCVPPASKAKPQAQFLAQCIYNLNLKDVCRYHNPPKKTSHGLANHPKLDRPYTNIT